jgi:hypothetical protein
MAAHYADMAAQCQRRIHVRAVEIDAERAQAAKALLGEQNGVHSAIESVSAVGQFGIVWLNPPYDQVSGGRAELAWLHMCAPFVGQINRHDPTGRLCELLERYGMRGAAMRAEEKQRVQFIRRALAQGADYGSIPDEALRSTASAQPPGGRRPERTGGARRAGVDVVFTSAPLVMVGIDLLETPTLVWFTAEYNVYVVQQANHRSLRIGQTEDVHVYYLAYDRTPQAYAMYRIAKKLAAAQTLQGDVRQGLAALLGEEDCVSRLQDATIHNEHYESEMSIDDLPPLVSFAPESLFRASRGKDVQVKVQTNGHACVRAMVHVEDLRQVQQLSLFA